MYEDLLLWKEYLYSKSFFVFSNINHYSPNRDRETSVDLRKHSIKITGGRSRKKHETSPEGMYEEVDDSARGERGM